MTRFVLPSPGKLNLFLHITGRRPDGYHTLQTLFQLVDLCDFLVFETSTQDRISLAGDLAGVRAEDNIVYRAGQLVREKLAIQEGVKITIQKRLPVGGGMGGGSSNAATTLIGLNLMWNGGLKQRDLVEMGLRLGADVPLFVLGQSAWGEGVGELLTPLELPERWFLVIVPDCSVSTGKIFQHQQLTRDTSPLKIARFLEQGAFFPDQIATPKMGNDCESLVRTLYPAIDEALNWLSQWSPARMTGTGASVFSTFDSEAEAAQVLDQVPDRWKGIITRGVNTSPLLDAEAEINDSIT